MNIKFRKKPVVIEAFQMTPERRISNADWPPWLHQAWNDGTLNPVNVEQFPIANVDLLSIRTLEGEHLVSWGDWIIQEVKGELYPCKNDIFEATYEPVEEAQ